MIEYDTKLAKLQKKISNALAKLEALSLGQAYRTQIEYRYAVILLRLKSDGTS
jgi:hypothetical protein